MSQILKSLLFPQQNTTNFGDELCDESNMPGGESTAGVEVQGASAASFSAPAAGYFGRMENFDLKVEEWSTYVESLEMFFAVNNVPN